MDLVLVGRRYVRVRDMSPWYRENPIAERILAETARSPARVSYHLSPRTWFHWVYGSFAHSGLDILEPEISKTGKPIPEVYQRFFSALEQSIPRMWQIANVRFIVGPRGMLASLIGNPGFELVESFDILTDRIVPALPGQGQNLLLRFKGGLPKALVYYDWEAADEDTALAKLKDTGWNPISSVLVSADLQGRSTGRRPTPARVVRYENNRIEVEADAVSDGILLLNDKYDSDWRVRVDGKPADLLPCNFLMRGVEIPQGRHRVVFTYRPYLVPFLISMAACAVLVVWGGMRVVSGRKREPQMAADERGWGGD